LRQYILLHFFKNSHFLIKILTKDLCLLLLWWRPLLLCLNFLHSSLLEKLSKKLSYWHEA
jgi:hypothetical protein